MSFSPDARYGAEGFQRGEEWVFFSSQPDRAEVLCVKPAEMTASIQPGVAYMRGWAQQEENLYYTVDRGNGSYFLYTSDLHFENVRLLGEIGHPQLSLAGDRIACYGGAGYPAIYDLKTETYEQLQLGYGVDSIKAAAGVLIVRHWPSEEQKTKGQSSVVWALDIATGEELPAADYADLCVSSCGTYTAFCNEQKQWRFAVGDGAPITAERIAMDCFSVGERAIICNSYGRLTVIYRNDAGAYDYEHGKK